MGQKIYFLENFEYLNGIVNSDDVIENLNKKNIIEVEAIFVKLKYKLDHFFLNDFPSLKYIVSPTTGITHIDTEYTSSKNIKIISLQGESSFLEGVPSTAEMTLLLILQIIRNFEEAKQKVLNGKWQRNTTAGSNIKDLRVLIIGYGRVGKQVADILNFFGAEVYIFDTDSNKKNIDKNSLSLNQLKKIKFDIVTIHANFSSDNNNYFDYDFFAKMQSGFSLVNTARGELICHDGLLKLLNEERIKSCALDVLPQEPNIDIKLLKALQAFGERICITPHIAGFTEGSLRMVEEKVYSKYLTMKNL